jgi:hypothetical protein
MQKLKSLAIGVGLLLVPTFAMADTLAANFSGHADNGSGTGGNYIAGTSYAAYLVLNETQDAPWYPFDGSKEYTAVLETTISSFSVLGSNQTINFAVATVNVYEDDVTAADYGSLGTFTDGTNILSGEAQNMIGSRLDIFGLPFDVTGVIVFDSGPGLGDVACTTGLLMNDFINFQFGTNPPGFEEAYDAEWKCEGIISIEEGTWGSEQSAGAR